MNRLIKFFLATACIATAAQAAPTAIIGKSAPYFTARDELHGTKINLAQLRGAPVVIEWNNFGCPFVKKHYQGNMQALQREAIAGGAHWISINSSASGHEGYLPDASAVKATLAAHQAAPSHYLLDHDGKIGRAYGATATPHMFVIDSKGMLVYAGAIDDKPTPNVDAIKTATNYVRDALAALKEGKPVAVAQTRAYGCGVKYAF